MTTFISFFRKVVFKILKEYCIMKEKYIYSTQKQKNQINILAFILNKLSISNIFSQNKSWLKANKKPLVKVLFECSGGARILVPIMTTTHKLLSLNNYNTNH